MVVYYPVFGKQVGSHVLAMLTLGTAATIGYVSTRGGSKEGKPTPPIVASSSDEEKFIKDFLKDIEADEKKTKAKH
ncbi:hypothetical protein BJ508DRAFT_410340 [Ascobolus immersus RN42]|uniref:ATP synthase subunit K, mitochondrial n=1 Tax=Ascobolus immersus RN42 TaxID=1160509 RepID=A0A3N4ITR3_ASCIM|nr:hypothetical protein BJ508DRAFT_410340 [Ascobolus immersus RN42]